MPSRPGPRGRAVLAVAAVALATAALAVVFFTRTAARIDVGVPAFDISRNPAVVTFEVHKPRNAVVTCTIRVRNRDEGIIGTTGGIVVPAGSTRTVLTRTVRWSVPDGPPVNADVESCVVTGHGR